MEWLYEHNTDNSARFTLGTIGVNPLICFGINPSTAEPNNLDPTVNYVNRLALQNGYDSFVMLNVYPQRATNPNDLHKSFQEDLKSTNERHIAALIEGKSMTLWAAWGRLITKRTYLAALVQSIVALPELQNCNWVSRGNITKDGHPHHPLYVKKEIPFVPFDMSRYIKRFSNFVAFQATSPPTASAILKSQ
ncbi:MAG: DUF1643 domain-containing protein [Planctomycetota bacterium]|jgi:hypothetical protein|nr:DUF1643 domain-containing protein [Planctomycetota bacterium]